MAKEGVSTSVFKGKKSYDFDVIFMIIFTHTEVWDPRQRGSKVNINKTQHKGQINNRNQRNIYLLNEERMLGAMTSVFITCIKALH